jgi:hypothetical protein
MRMGSVGIQYSLTIWRRMLEAVILYWAIHITDSRIYNAGLPASTMITLALSCVIRPAKLRRGFLRQALLV